LTKTFEVWLEKSTKKQTKI